jgi:predicted DNA-binding antitoxin AbrB/MazE fold protein
MSKTLPAIYENGLLRPLEPLELKEHQRVRVTADDFSDDPAGALLDHEYHAAIDAMDEEVRTLEEVRTALGPVRGKLSDAVSEDRDARG